MNPFACTQCDKSYKKKAILKRHCNIKKHKMPEYPVKILKPKKIYKKKTIQSIFCEKCKIDVLDYNSHQKSTEHRNNCLIQINEFVERVATAFNCRISSYRIRK